MGYQNLHDSIVICNHIKDYQVFKCCTIMPWLNPYLLIKQHDSCHMRSRISLPFCSTKNHPLTQFMVRLMMLSLLFFMLGFLFNFLTLMSVSFLLMSLNVPLISFASLLQIRQIRKIWSDLYVLISTYS